MNPGGVEVWKQGGNNVSGLDENVPRFDVTAGRSFARWPAVQ